MWLKTAMLFVHPRLWIKEERGVTTVEWLGMAAIAVLVVAMLVPQVRSGARAIWNSIEGQLTGYFG